MVSWGCALTHIVQQEQNLCTLFWHKLEDILNGCRSSQSFSSVTCFTCCTVLWQNMLQLNIGQRTLWWPLNWIFACCWYRCWFCWLIWPWCPALTDIGLLCKGQHLQVCDELSSTGSAQQLWILGGGCMIRLLIKTSWNEFPWQGFWT